MLSVLIALACFIDGSSAAASSRYSAIFSFGNSYTDTGNIAVRSNFSLPDAPASRPPYGMTFFRHANGRSSDGRLAIDFIAAQNELPFLPPYLALNQTLGPHQYRKGVNFAIAGATTLDIGYFIEGQYRILPLTKAPLNIQLGWFDKIRSSLCTSDEDCRELFKNALFFVGEFGVNDYHVMFLNNKSVEEAQSVVPSVIKVISSTIEKLINSGAATVTVSGVTAMGCEPLILTLYPGLDSKDYDPLTGCLIGYNKLAARHNSQLQEATAQIQQKYNNVSIIYVDFYQPVIDFIRSPARYGFVGGTLRDCCGEGGTYNYNSSHLCGMQGATVCANPSTYISWDGVHYTEAANRQIASRWLQTIRRHSNAPSSVLNLFPSAQESMEQAKH